MAKSKKVAATTAAEKKKVVSAPVHIEHKPLESGRRGRTLTASAPQFKFTTPGDSIECTVIDKIVPDGGKHAGKLIGYIAVDLKTGEQVMIGNTHAIERALNSPIEDGSLTTVYEAKVPIAITFVGLKELEGGKSFNQFDICLIEQ